MVTKLYCASSCEKFSVFWPDQKKKKKKIIFGTDNIFYSTSAGVSTCAVCVRHICVLYEDSSKSNASHFMMLAHYVGDTEVEAEPSHRHPIAFCCCATDGSRGAVWQSDIWHGSADEVMVCHCIPPCGKNYIHWHSSTISEYLQRPNSGCEHSEVVGGAFQ